MERLSNWGPAIAGHRKLLILFGGGNLLLAALLIATRTDYLWSAVLLLWTNLVFYGLARWRKRVFLLAFLSTFFLFLLSRETLSRTFGYGTSAASPQTYGHLVMVLALGLLGLGAGFIATHHWPRRSSPKPRRRQEPWLIAALGDRPSLQMAAMVAFWATLPATVYFYATRIMVVLQNSYTELYGEEYRTAASGGLMAVANQLYLMNNVAFLALLATFPTLRRALAPLAAYLVLLGMSLATGQRAGFLLGLVLLFCYAVTRSVVTPKDPWLTRRRTLRALLAVPVLMLAMVAVEIRRGVGSDFASGIFGALVDFLYNQGVSATVIVNVLAFGEELPDQAYLTEFAHSGLIARALGIPVLQGNSVAHATEGASLAHSISYVVLGDSYLAGRGAGSSFLAEAFVDLGYAGVFAIAMVYGIGLALMGQIGPRRFLFTTVMLLTAQDFFWAPRGSATSFISSVLAPSTILCLVGIVGFSLAVREYKRRRDAQPRPRRSVPEGTP